MQARVPAGVGTGDRAGRKTMCNEDAVPAEASSVVAPSVPLLPPFFQCSASHNIAGDARSRGAQSAAISSFQHISRTVRVNR